MNKHREYRSNHHDSYNEYSKQKHWAAVHKLWIIKRQKPWLTRLIIDDMLQWKFLQRQWDIIINVIWKFLFFSIWFYCWIDDYNYFDRNCLLNSMLVYIRSTRRTISSFNSLIWYGFNSTATRLRRLINSISNSNSAFPLFKIN